MASFPAPSSREIVKRSRAVLPAGDLPALRRCLRGRILIRNRLKTHYVMRVTKLNIIIALQPEQARGNSVLTFGNGSMKHCKEDSILETSTKHNDMNCNVESRSILNTSQDFKDLRVGLDSWPDQDSGVTGQMGDLNDVTLMMTNSPSGRLLHKKNLSSFSISCAPLCSNLSTLYGEPVLFGHDEEGNSRFLNYDWANIEHFDDFDNMFRNIESFCRNEMVHSTDVFFKTSGDVISNTFRSVPVPEDEQNQTPMLLRKEKGKDMFFQDLNYSCSSEKHSTSCCEVECSTMSSHIHLQSQPVVQGSSSCDVMYADYEYPPSLFPGFPFQPQSHEISDKAGEAEQKSDDIASHDQNTIEEYNWKFTSSEVCSMIEQDQSKLLSSSIDEIFAEEAIYYQLQESMGKLEMKARVAISNSLFRLARSAMERQSTCGRSWNVKNMEEDVTSAGRDLQWQSRSIS
ncbi:hypothetical protein KSP39_PZI001395 [Platanthera zijinensis]|uniref:Uncharacterized protein n=1 Tax=Platanthera zijinensis TaxID=2320716 RepID=A0AAP0C1X9_9ASPA